MAVAALSSPATRGGMDNDVARAPLQGHGKGYTRAGQGLDRGNHGTGCARQTLAADSVVE
eukprot:5139205-Alexandrium_andersonii.AAC.1